MQEPVNPGYEQPAIRQPVSSQPIGFGPTPQPVQCSACGAKVSKTQKINCRCGLLFKGAVQGKLANNHDFLSPFVITTGSSVLLENEENGVFKQPLFYFCCAINQQPLVRLTQTRSQFLSRGRFHANLQ